jgi:hypothetical protein
LAEPVVMPARGGVVVRYLIAVFAPGSHALPMPDADVLRAGGVTEAVPGDTARFAVVSVLPAGDSLPEPRASLGPLPRASPRLLPLVVLVAGALGTGAGWWGLRRRRGRRPDATHPAEKPSRAPLARWMAAGEARAVAAAATGRLRRAIAEAEPHAHTALNDPECLALLKERRPAWPLAELADTLAGLERAGYAPAIPADVLATAEQAEELAAALERRR